MLTKPTERPRVLAYYLPQFHPIPENEACKDDHAAHFAALLPASRDAAATFARSAGSSPDAPLAIVVPAYKGRFLEIALESLARQSDGRFCVYVGDDASPEPLKWICDRFAGRLELRYHRFPENIGRRSLAAQWTRSVRLSCEPWVWLFSDDDFAHEDCVAAFFRALADARPGVEVYRFPVGIIDQDGRILSDVRSFAALQGAGAFVHAKLREEIDSFAVEYVFAREAFERAGGFVEFPAGWCSDDASWCAMAGRHGIGAIPGGGVFWRRSGVNVSATQSPFARDKIVASIGYLEWLDERLGDEGDSLGGASDAEIRAQFRRWFYGQLSCANPVLGPLTAVRIARRLARLTRRRLAPDLYGLFRNEARALARRTRERVMPHALRKVWAA